MNKENLKENANKMMAKPKGLLAMDESSPTCAKRFAGVGIEDSENNRFYINENFEEILSTINLADTFYENSFYSIKDIPISFRFSILVARRVYRKIGDKIKNKKNLENYQNSGKIYVSNVEKVLETFLSIFDLIRLSFSHKLDDEIQHDHNLINEEIKLDERI